MTDAMRKRFAEFEGIEICYPSPKTSKCPMMVGQLGQNKYVPIPSYDNDADLDRVVRLLPYSVLREYHLILREMVRESQMDDDDILDTLTHQAPENQKQAALIAAMGWRN